MNYRSLILIIILKLIGEANGQIGAKIGSRCLDNGYYYDQDAGECLPLCQAGERHDEDYYCIEIVYIKAGPDYLQDAAEQSFWGIISMFIIIVVILMSFCFDGEQKQIDRHDRILKQIQKLQEGYSLNMKEQDD